MTGGEDTVPSTPLVIKERPCWTDALPLTDHVNLYRKAEFELTELGPISTWPLSLRNYVFMVFTDSRAACVYEISSSGYVNARLTEADTGESERLPCMRLPLVSRVFVTDYNEPVIMINSLLQRVRFPFVLHRHTHTESRDLQEKRIQA